MLPIRVKGGRSMEKRVELNLLMDFYGALLTEHARDILRMYVEEDLSLQEIADSLGITRQAVHESLTRSERQLHEYEDKLGLLSRFRAMKARLSECQTHLDTALKALEQAGNILKNIE